jgi:hypothetical protein
LIFTDSVLMSIADGLLGFDDGEPILRLSDIPLRAAALPAPSEGLAAPSEIKIAAPRP